MELLLVRELADQITKSSKPGRITVSILNPGFVKTDIMRDATWLFQIYVVSLSAALARTAEEGGRILVNAAEGGEETHGQYLDDCTMLGHHFGTPTISDRQIHVHHTKHSMFMKPSPTQFYS